MSNYSIILSFALSPLLANISAPKVFIRIPQPKTNVNWYEYVKSYPPWAKNLEVELGLGKTLVTFTGIFLHFFAMFSRTPLHHSTMLKFCFLFCYSQQAAL